MAVTRITVTFDRNLPLGPQILAARIFGLPWKMIAGFVGFSARHCQKLAEAAVAADESVVQQRHE